MRRQALASTLARMGDGYVTSPQAAKELGIHLVTLQRWAKAGIVTPAFRTAGGRYRWDLDDLKRQLRERKDDDR